ncbi:TMEM175 family protein [Lacticaseibacillus zhaodongensis]|uniref:TMEM175 family protein n=1 Tax=Lacticaseibacillus zhaodongensis TaxID=2668065 RepID=UPI0012D2A6F8|nr:TMEM175 family protein [Lacticaseibacillus zhaodongensis]
MEKLKNRLDAFSDAIIAIIITIMVLDIPPVLHDSLGNYLLLGKHVGVYLISFIFVANIWYEHSTAFGEIATMTYRILIFEIIFLAFLALMPLFTNMMAQNTTRTTVILYGLLQFLVNYLFRYLAKVIVHLQYTDKTEMQKVYVKIYGNANRYLDILSIVALVVAYFFPEAALFFYLAYPVLSFLLNSAARQEMGLHFLVLEKSNAKSVGPF